MDEYPVETMARLGYSDVESVADTYIGDPFHYQDGVTTSLLRSGRDGPHVKLADDMCGLRRDSV